MTEKGLNKTVYSDFEIRISLSFNLPEKEWEDVVIHEMIHLLIAHKNIKDTGPHGVKFREIMNQINRLHDRNIIVSAKRKPGDEDIMNPGKVKAHNICLGRFKDGRLGVAPVATTQIFRLWDYLDNFPGVKETRWIGSTDTWFNKIPHIRKPKFFLLQEEELTRHLKGACRLFREGERIKAVSNRFTPEELKP